MEVEYLGEYGYDFALLGLSKSHEGNIENMPKVAEKLSGMGGGHDQFLTHIDVWINVKAPLSWWKQFDKYKLRMPDLFGFDIITQSESTMHTIKKRFLTQNNFEYPIDEVYLYKLNKMIEDNVDINVIENALPLGFLQSRTMKLNYMQIINIINQRKNHKLNCWITFINVFVYLKHIELVKTKQWIGKELLPLPYRSL